MHDLQTANKAVHVLMVSRSNIFMPQSTYAVDIGRMSKSAAGQLLRNTCPNVPLLGSVAEELADHCGCNATLVVFVGGVLNRRGQSHVEVSFEAYHATAVYAVPCSPSLMFRKGRRCHARIFCRQSDKPCALVHECQLVWRWSWGLHRVAWTRHQTLAGACWIGG